MRAPGVAALGAAMLLAALAFATGPLYLPSIALLVLAVASWAWVALAAAGAALERTAGPPTVEEESPWPVRLELRRGIVRAPGGELVEPLLEATLPLRRVRRRVRVDVRFERRGRRALEPARVVMRDPLGLAERRLVSTPLEVLVLPRVDPVLATHAGGAAGEGTLSRSALDTAELEPDALRPYRPGAPATRIHWPAVARTGEIFERSLASDASSRPLVVLDARGAASEAALDGAVRAAASLCVHLARSGGCSVLLPGDRRATELGADMRSWHGVHVRLALVEAGGAPIAGRIERSGAIYWVSAATSVPAGLLRSAARERWFVSPAGGSDRGAGAAAAFVVSGCSGRRLRQARAARRVAA